MMRKIIGILHDEGHALVLLNGSIHTYDERGVSTLYRLLQENAPLLKGALVADKVVGKAAAALMVLGGVREVYADVVSQLALDLLGKTKVEVSYGKVVPHIVNRLGTDWCPMETRCVDCQTPEECLVEIEKFIKDMAKGH